GVTIAPANPPAPRLSVLPAPIDVAPGELTTPPSAMVSVPTGLQPRAGQRQRSRVVELERAPAGERAGERGGAGADDAQQGGRTGRSDRDRAAARQRPDLDKGPVADRQGRARVDGEDRFK